MKCAHCNDTGETGQGGILDCGYCDAAIERAALCEAVKRLGRMTEYDLVWHVYNAGKEAALAEYKNRVNDQ